MREGWETKTLADICDVFADGDWIESKDQSNEGIRLIQTGNIGQGYFKNRDEKSRYVSETTFKKLRCTEIFAGDCLVSRLPDPVGRACILPEINIRMITGVDCSIIRFNRTFFPEWFLYFSLSTKYQKQIDSQISGSTRQRISRKNLGLIAIPCPPLSEQERIVSILDQAFAAIAKAKENAEKNLQNAKELFQTYLQRVFEDKGEGWEEKTLNEISDNLDSKRVPITKNIRNGGVIPYYGASGVVDYVASHLFDEDLLCISEDGANLLARTYPIAFSISGKSWVNNHAHVLRFKNSDTQKFVELYLNSIRLDDYVSGMAQPKLNQAMLNKIPIPFPRLEVQHTIVKKLHELSSETVKLQSIYQQKLSNLEELKKAILQKAFSGELTHKEIPEMI